MHTQAILTSKVLLTEHSFGKHCLSFQVHTLRIIVFIPFLGASFN